MKKRWEVFCIAEGAIIMIYSLLCLAAGRVLFLTGTLMILLSVYWCGYYYSLKYTIGNNVLEITSGILFKKRRSIPLSNILWEMRLTSPFFAGSAMTVLHTSGGNAVVFCDFSTYSR